MDNKLEKNKQKITNFIDKIYLEKDKKKLYPLIYKITHLSFDKIYIRKIKNWFLYELPREYDKKIVKISRIAFGHYSSEQRSLREPDLGWIEYKNKRESKKKGGKIIKLNQINDGLIFRLKNLWFEIDKLCINEDYNGWNNHLDQIYKNLSQEGMTKFMKGKKDKITAIRIVEGEWRYLSQKVNRCKRLNLKADTENDKKVTRGDWYKSLEAKDIWLRILMIKFGLYLKGSKKKIVNGKRN